jgi:restriction system protein
VGRPALQAFVGALHGQAAHKGVFITTSSFTRDALDYVRGLGNMRVILIDGPTLAGLMIDHDVGVRPHRTVTLKRLDLDYFEDGDV